MDTIIIRGLKCSCLVGVNPEERTRRQDILIDLELSLDLSAASHSDDLEDTVDYHALAERVRGTAEESGFFLIERLAGEIAEVCLKTPPVTAVTVTVRKPEALENADYPAVRLYRKR
ncbi:MAG: dihydroneopterin aldolase [Spirochaetia bacterium]